MCHHPSDICLSSKLLQSIFSILQPTFLVWHANLHNLLSIVSYEKLLEQLNYTDQRLARAMGP